MKKINLFFAVVFGLLFLFASCQTMQRDLMLSSIDEAASADIIELEKKIVPLDADYSRSKASSIRRQINDLEKQPIQDMAFKAQLAAWSGRLFLLEGSRSDAEKQLRISRQHLPGNLQAVILGIRLEPNLQKRLELIDSSLKIEKASGELIIEKARVYFELRQYREAVAAFDRAFALLPLEVYRETYSNDRNKAWELININSARGRNTADIATRSEISWRDVIDITQTETELLAFITAGRYWTPEQLFPRLLSRSFIPASRSVLSLSENAKRPSIDDVVLRCGAAWFLWHLVAENRSDKTLLTRYSVRYRNMANARTPIADIPLSSPYLDSVLGCVEWEIMTLPDGKNFFPDDPVRGTAFINMLSRIKK
jgi:tetratricopeptide (TPR) repeat protein